MTALLERLYPIPADLCWTKKQYQEFRRDRMKAKLTVEYATPFIEQAAGTESDKALLLNQVFGLPLPQGFTKPQGYQGFYNRFCNILR